MFPNIFGHSREEIAYILADELSAADINPIVLESTKNIPYLGILIIEGYLITFLRAYDHWCSFFEKALPGNHFKSMTTLFPGEITARGPQDLAGIIHCQIHTPRCLKLLVEILSRHFGQRLTFKIPPPLEELKRKGLLPQNMIDLNLFR